MRELILRECQEPMLDIITRLDRCNVFASPGTGKTSATLAALDVLSIVDNDVWPVLVVAPKRVANGVWHKELAEWTRFAGLTLQRVVGSRIQREKALGTLADIYTINPANLIWLHAQVGDNWPFRTVISDESTLIKSHRCRFQTSKLGKVFLVVDGSKQASSLVRHAPKVKHWINLTGTPTPNGVKDLWGQQWPIDFGEALGSSHSAFAQRWFRPAMGSSREQQRIEALPGAEVEIVDRIKPVTAMIDAYDYFDIERPVEIDIEIELPPAVRKSYQELHRESIAEIMDFKVNALNAGAKVMKCRQIASGHVMDTEGRWQTLHKEKLDALDELVEKLDGQPLLVAYWFKADLIAIKSRFKNAVELPSDHKQEEVEDAWNQGKIDMLLVHPQSAGHGLSLQHGGNNLCVYTMDWNAEYYEQVIERIGPTRQAQSGYKRLTYVWRLITSRTWERVVADRLREKFDMSETVKRALAL